MDVTTNSLNWFEIPVLDLTRSKTFYETIFGISMERFEMDGEESAFFPMDPQSGKVSGSLSKSDTHTPSLTGTTVYLNANPKMDEVLARVTGAGGSIQVPKTAIGPHGFVAFIIDTEGNRVGIHSNA